MTIWYIGPSGSDTTGNGTSGSPYATVTKCISVGVNGDTVKALTGTYTISSTTNITKQITVTSNSGVKTDVIFNSNTTVFNVQSNNVSITYVTLQTSSASALVTIDRMSTGTTVPTFWTGITINNCNIKYVTNALELNGTFTVTSNTFTRMSGTNIATIIKVYTTRGSCSVSSNTFTDSQPVQYIIQNTSSGSGIYLDMCNSKGGVLTITSNTVTFTHASQVTTFLFHDYFNQYNYVTSPSVNYNPNTKLSLLINNNNISYTTTGKSTVMNTLSSLDYNMFGSCNINTNTFNNVDYGALHLGKNTNVSSALTISSSDLNRSLFKIYSNTLDTIPPPSPMVFDMSVSGTLRKSDGTAAAIGDYVKYIRLNTGSASNPIVKSTNGNITSKRIIKYGIETVGPNTEPDGNEAEWIMPSPQACGYLGTVYYDWSFFMVASVDPTKIVSMGYLFMFRFSGFGMYQAADSDVLGIYIGGGPDPTYKIYDLDDLKAGTKVISLRFRPTVAGVYTNFSLTHVVTGQLTEVNMNTAYSDRTVLTSLGSGYNITIGSGAGGLDMPFAISEIRLYPYSVNDTDFMSIHNSLKTKWNAS